jgi:hypothetical protein
MKTTLSLADDTLPAVDAYTLALRIAAHLSGPERWTAQRHSVDPGARRGFAELRREGDGAEIGVSVGGYREEGRVTFRAHWPRFKDGRQWTPRKHLAITCSAGRDPRALAREVERRLLVDYEPAYREALDYVRKSDAAADDARCTAERIAVAIGAELPREGSYQQQRSGERVDLHGGPPSVRRLQVRPGYSDAPTSVSFEVHDLDEQTALRLLTLLGQSDDEGGR